MDPDTIDHLARIIGAGQSRRAVLKTLAGGATGVVAAAIGLRDGASAHALRSVGNSCTTNSDCASNLCVQESRTRKICHCQSGTDCLAVDACHTATCAAGACVQTPVSCDDGNLCTTDTCDPAVGCVHEDVVCGGFSESCCGGACVETGFNPNNCGGCGNVCITPANGTATCSAGGCGVTCNDGYQPDGNGGCVAILTSTAHCWWLSPNPIIGWSITTSWVTEAECNAANHCDSGGACYQWSEEKPA